MVRGGGDKSEHEGPSGASIQRTGHLASGGRTAPTPAHALVGDARP